VVVQLVELRQLKEIDMKSRIHHTLALGATLGLVLTGGPACMQFDDGVSGELPLATNVTDWRDEIIYQLLVDRFADGDAGNNYRVNTAAPGKWHGGDWKGVEDKLDYIESLGVTTLWISPVVKNVDTDAGFDGYHGYWAQDLSQPNPHFGDLPALRHMIAAAHQKHMKVILDIVTNHMGQVFYYDINKNGQPDENVSGSGLHVDSNGNPTDTVVHINEYDPDFNPRGVQSRTSLGESGPAPIIFVYDPASNHIPPMPEVFQNLQLRRLGSAPPRRLPRRPERRGHHPVRRQRGHGRLVYSLGGADRSRRLPHRYGQARGARVLALLRPEGAATPRRAGQEEILHVR
jgi:hypothetical protein